MVGIEGARDASSFLSSRAASKKLADVGEWLASATCTERVVCAGNHDAIVEVREVLCARPTPRRVHRRPVA